MPHIPTASFPLCRLCQKHVPLESCNTDENGQVVHGLCYVQWITGCNQSRAPSGSFSTET
jgi:hypothetical protein